MSCINISTSCTNGTETSYICTKKTVVSYVCAISHGTEEISITPDVCFSLKLASV